MQKITPCLWFDDKAEEAVDFYVSIFPRSRKLAVTRYGEAGAKASGRPKGSVMTVDFELFGQRFQALNGGPLFPFTEAVSFVVDCRTQKELDKYWDRLLQGGQAVQCGWLKDKFGLSWQVVPVQLAKLIQDRDPEKAERVMAAMLKMVKLDIETLKEA